MCMNAHTKNVVENWDDVRIAYHVARLGTLSAAAAFLGVHHATVIRRITALEGRLGSKLFQRHPRGYTPTEAGRELMKVASVTEEHLDQLSGRIRGRGAAVSGDLVVTSLAAYSALLVPWLAEFQQLHPETRITLIADDRPLKLELGEAHVAIRAGKRPQEADNIVQHFMDMEMAIYGSQTYVEAHPKITCEQDLAGHRFVGSVLTPQRAPFSQWMHERIPPEAITFKSSRFTAVQEAVRAGMGLSILSMLDAETDPRMVRVFGPLPEWSSKIWLLSHVDLHRSAKVQAILGFLKEKVRRIKPDQKRPA